jgi:hypothetical protein
MIETTVKRYHPLSEGTPCSAVEENLKALRRIAQRAIARRQSTGLVSAISRSIEGAQVPCRSLLSYGIAAVTR